MTQEEVNAGLERCRAQIDVIDRQIADLLNQRARVAEAIGDLKQHAQMKVYEPKREDAVFQNVTSANAGPLRNDSLKRIYERIIDEMRTLQRDRMAAKLQQPGETKS